MSGACRLRWAWFLVMIILLAVVSSCAPKQVRIYDGAEGTRSDIIQHATSVLGKPYKNGAKGPDAFDCSGLIHFAYKRVNIALPVMTEKQIEAGLEVPPANVLPGDLVFFKIKKDYHVGMMLNKKDFIHSSTTKGVSVDNIESTYWKRSLVCFRSILQY
jgi:cell wall-associated NlpC family hydrolase